MDSWTREQISKIVKEALSVDQDDLIYELSVTFKPEDIFDNDTLTEWAEQNGFIHEDRLEEYKLK
jgi:hypothetical protein